MRAVEILVERRLHPSTLPSLVPEAAAGPRPRPAFRAPDRSPLPRGVRLRRLGDHTPLARRRSASPTTASGKSAMREALARQLVTTLDAAFPPGMSEATYAHYLHEFLLLDDEEAAQAAVEGLVRGCGLRESP